MYNHTLCISSMFQRLRQNRKVKDTIPDMRSRFNAFSPITERFIFPLWTVSIFRICLKIKDKKKEERSYS